MRVYEFAKQHNVSSKELINKLSMQGFKVSSHMSVLGEEELKFLQDEIDKSIRNGGDMSQLQETTSQKKTKQVPVLKSVEQDIVKKAPAVQAMSVQNEPSLMQAQDKVSSEKATEDVVVDKKELILTSMTLGDLAHAIDKPITELILFLLRLGIPVTKNQVIPESAILKIAEHYHLNLVKPVVKEDDSEVLGVARSQAQGSDDRLPVVVVIGHVDHGKTTLLDFIRKTRVAAKEKGGITQHIGAYEATTAHGNIIFVDTPGHEAFGKMRQRGIKVADIAILMIAADDGVMPQTIEAIRQAKLGRIPVVVAINKVDKADQAAIDRVKQQITQYGLLPEEWGGDVVCVPISAKDGTGVDHLLEMIILQAQLMDLKTHVDRPAKGYVLESKFEKGRGSVATVICHDGEVRLGQYFVCGETVGRVTSMVNSFGQNVSSAGASIPVRISGFEELPEVGDEFLVVSKEKYRASRSGNRRTMNTGEETRRISLRENSINILLKADTHSSLEALRDSINKLSNKQEIGINVISSGVGDVNESDVSLALTLGAEIISFHVKVESNALSLSQKGVVIHSFDIIYRLLEFLEEKVRAQEVVPVVLKKTGEAIVLKVFDIKGVGVIAGAQIKDGVFHRKATVVVWRHNKKVGEGRIESLQRDKKSVKEVTAGFECAFMIDGFVDWVAGDRVECFIEQ